MCSTFLFFKVCLTDGTLRVENPVLTAFYSASAYNVDSLYHCNTTGVLGPPGIYTHFLITGCEKVGLFNHTPIHYFETVPNSKKLQTKTEMWLLKGFKIQIV